MQLHQKHLHQPAPSCTNFAYCLAGPGYPVCYNGDLPDGKAKPMEWLLILLLVLLIMGYGGFAIGANVMQILLVILVVALVVWVFRSMTWPGRRPPL